MSLEVLLVEDSPGDVRLTQEAFHAVNPAVHLHVANDGVEALAFLRHEGVYVDAPRPDLTLLDLNMPRMDGRQALALIKNDDQPENDSYRDPDHIRRRKGTSRKAINCMPIATSASPCS